MIELSSQLAPFREAQVLRLATCWKITRRDGMVLRFTNHDTELVVYDEVYYPRGTLNHSSVNKTEDFDGGSKQVLGTLTDDRITHADLLAGVYRDAEIIEYIVDWQETRHGHLDMTRYWISKVEFSDHQWKGTVEGVSRYLQSQVGNVYGRNCRYALGDSNCRVNLTGFTELDVTVSSVISQRYEFVPSETIGEEFNFGVVTWETGNNRGTSNEILNTDNGSISLVEPTAYNIGNGDIFSVVYGCDRTRETCHYRFQNTINYGGFPLIPNRDSLIEVPGLDETSE